MVPAGVSVWLVTVAGWLVVAAVVAAVVLWLLERAVNVVVRWAGITPILKEFAAYYMGREKCTCGAVAHVRRQLERKPLPTVQEDHDDTRRPFD